MKIDWVVIKAMFLFVFLVCAFLAEQSPAKTYYLSDLRCEYKVDPVGIDVLKPRLSWKIHSIRRDVVQTAYQIRAAESERDLKSKRKLLWDSGKLDSDQSIHVVYDGPELKSRQRVYWQVMVWDNNGKSTAWSEPAFWEMGLLGETDWKASWIRPDIEEEIKKSSPCPMLRAEFDLDKDIRSARAYIASHGLYLMELNGQKVGDQVLTPGWTSYDNRIQYQTYDITGQLERDKNAVGVTLGDGWYRGHLGWGDNRNAYGERLALIVQIEVAYRDGSEEIITSDATWKASTGPILMSDIYMGETYDARLEKKGWTNVGYDVSDWKGVRVENYPKDVLVAPPGPPVKRIEEIKSVEILKTPAGETVFDMGQNMVGWIRLKVNGPAGTTVVLRHAEVLDKEGNFYTENLRAAKQTVSYTLKGEGEELFEPHFTFQGFRYVAVSGFPGEPDLTSLTGVVVHSAATPTGSFECSNPMINQLQHNIQWGQKGNFVDVPTDCPQRDERMGWTGDAQAFARTACFNLDVAAFYTKWLKDVAADQKASGAIPHVIPDVLSRNRPDADGSSGWGDAATIVPWTVYLCYGDKRLLEQQYESMKGWVGYIERKAGTSYLWNTGHHYGDWLAFNTTRSDYPGATTDKDFIATAFFAYSTDLVWKTAEVLGKTVEAKKYEELLRKIKKAFQNEFVTANGRLSSNTQTAYTLALAFDLLPESMRDKAAKRLADDVKSFGHITTGFLGTPLICHVLSDYGYTDLAYMLLNRKEYPSWLYPITMGATTIWERWDGIKPDGTFQDRGMNSFNHYAYGAIGDWLYRVVAGIEIDEKEPGYKHVIIQPHPGGELEYAAAYVNSMYGRVSSDWKLDDGTMQVDIEIPVNSHATVTLPMADAERVKESGRALAKANGVREIEQNEKAVVLQLGSGNYRFEYKTE